MSQSASTVEPMLTDAEKRVLDFAQRWWKHRGAQEAAIRAELGMSPTRYFQMLRRLAEDQQALAYAPRLVNRLRG